MKESIKTRIQRASANINLKEIKMNGYKRVANPKAVAEKIEKYTGQKIEISDGNMLTLI